MIDLVVTLPEEGDRQPSKHVGFLTFIVLLNCF
jgi:hypothetical protein